MLAIFWLQRANREKMVGNRRETGSRDPMRRTTSLTEFAPPEVLSSVFEEEEEVVVAHQQPDNGGGQDWLAAFGGAGGAAKQEEWLAAYRARAAPARAGLRRNSADCSATEAAAFLRSCGLCRRRLGPGRDTFMYKYVLRCANCSRSVHRIRSSTTIDLLAS